MEREIIPTADGSVTVAVKGADITYHSVHGAIRESQHVFIEAGYRHWLASAGQPAAGLRILEMGFGTGLNALLTLIESQERQLPAVYETIEAYPLEAGLLPQLNYCRQLNRPELQPLFEQLHSLPWNREIAVTPFFTLHKHAMQLAAFFQLAEKYRQPPASASGPFHLIYFDAFDPNAQPELWTTEIFRQLFRLLHPGGLLTTYCSKGAVRRAMQAAGFIVEKIPGPPGKREIVRAQRLK